MSTAPESVASVTVGSTINDITLPATGGDFTLSAERGKFVVLYFYPKDNTPGCTTQAQQFRDLHADFLQANSIVLGVSRDSLKSHSNFKEKFGLNFDLIADTESALCGMFGVIKQKMMYGKKVVGIERSTFLIDTHGVLVKEWRGTKADGNAATVLAALRTLQS